MRSRVIAIALAFAFATCTSACFADTAAPTVPIEKLFAAFNADSGVRLSETYAPDAVIVDELPPFVWRGPSAGISFWTSFLALCKAFKISDLHLSHGPLAFLRYDEAKNTAYVVAPTTITDRESGKPSKESGQWVFVIKKISGKWLIENSSWATVSY